MKKEILLSACPGNKYLQNKCCTKSVAQEHNTNWMERIFRQKTWNVCWLGQLLCVRERLLGPRIFTSTRRRVFWIDLGLLNGLCKPEKTKHLNVVKNSLKLSVLWAATYKRSATWLKVVVHHVTYSGSCLKSSEIVFRNSCRVVWNVR